MKAQYAVQQPKIKITITYRKLHFSLQRQKQPILPQENALDLQYNLPVNRSSVKTQAKSLSQKPFPTRWIKQSTKSFLMDKIC
jgi:hypothetical protein